MHAASPGGHDASAMARAKRLLLLLELVGTLVILSASGLMVLQLREKALESAEREITNVTALLEEQTARAVQSVALILRSTEERLREARQEGFLSDGRAINTLLRARIGGVPQVRALTVLDGDGHIRHTSRAYPPPSVSWSDEASFRTHLADPEGGLYIERPTRNKLDGLWAVQMSRPIPDGDGQLRGVIMAAVNPDYFRDLYRSINLGGGSSIALYLRDGTRIAAWPYQEETIGKSYADSVVFRILDAVGNRPIRKPVRLEDGEPRLVAFRALTDYPLVVAVRVDERSLLAQWRQDAGFIAAGSAAMLMILLIATSALRRALKRDERLTGALHDSEARTKTIVESAMDAIISIDEAQRVVLFNPAAEKMFGCSVAEALGAPLDRFIPEPYRAAHKHHVHAFGKTGISSRAMGENVDIRGLRADGEEFPIDASVSHGIVGGKKLFTVIVRDVTKRREAEAELRDSHARLRELSGALQSVREEERTRIARELHDELGQQLTGLKMDLTWLSSRIPDPPPPVQDKLNGIKGLVDLSVRSVRRIASELRPLMLDDLGLVPAIEWLAEDFSNRNGIEVHLDLELGNLELKEALATAVFRITQESLTNVARHAKAENVHVTIEQQDGNLVLTVRDDGQGMAPGSERKAKSFGLVGIKERALFLHGEAHIDSRPGEGTSVRVVLPVGQPSATREEAL